MRIRSITLQGFRGFNEERTIQFHDHLTLIYAPNSYGKTSVSEAFEWLLYGVTSKVDMAEYKDEYKGSYRNRHLPQYLPATVAVIFFEGITELECKVELGQADAINRSVNGSEVATWPFADQLTLSPRPFILQHTLKHLLLAKPDERYKGFARLLGLEELEQLQRQFVSLCTKPDASCIPPEVEKLIRDITAIEARLASQPKLTAIGKALKKGLAGLPKAYEAIVAECRRRLPKETSEESFLPQLLQMREEATGKIFNGSFTLTAYSTSEQRYDADDSTFFLDYGNKAFVSMYMELVALATVQHILDRVSFLDLGIALLADEPNTCPLCGQSVDDSQMQHVQSEHTRLKTEQAHTTALRQQRSEVEKRLGTLHNRLIDSHARHASKVTSLLAQQTSLAQLQSIFVPKHQQHFNQITTAISEITVAQKPFDASFRRAIQVVEQVVASIAACKEDSNLIRALGDALVEYIAETQRFTQVVSGHAARVSEADQILKYELDKLAGTEDLGVLVELLEQWGDIKKKFEVSGILDSLKELRKDVDQYTTRKMLTSISEDLTTEVMRWYAQIRTTGDPDVHFAGFDMEKTAKGEMKARRVEIKASSYGIDLASAVSSLSESKLNALGICMSIATNMQGASPFDFLVIDDPIQSLDEEHETQFVAVIRELVERGKQVILLSHNRGWIDQVRNECRTINGWFYEITGYTKVGPHICPVPWTTSTARLQEVDAIVKDPTAGSVRLQQAEEEIRIVVAELASKLYERQRKTRISPHGLNSVKVRKMLVECGVELKLVDKIFRTFTTTDPAHHVPVGYSAQRERIRQYAGWVRELEQLLKQEHKQVPPDAVTGIPQADVRETLAVIDYPSKKVK